MRTFQHFVFLYLIFLTTVLRAQTLPALPPLVTDNFAPPIREQVVKAYDDALSLSRNAEAQGRLGMLLQAYEQYEAALICFERARLLAPRDFRWTYYSGLARATLGDHQQAILRFTEVTQQKPDFLVAQIRLADSLFALNRWEESGRAYQAVLAKDARSAHAHYGLGRVSTARRDSSAAIEHLLRAINLDGNFGAAHYALAMAYRDAGNAESAKEHFALSQKNKSERPPLDDQLLDAVEALNVSAAEYLRRGVALDAAGNIEASIAQHERALHADPQLVQAHLNLILLYHRSNRFDKVEEHYQAAVKIDPQSAESHYNYGVALAERNRFAEAAQAFLRALQINPHYAEANHNYGVMLERENRLDEAMKYYRIAIEDQPNYRLAHFHLARILVNRGNLTDAITHLQKTLAPEDESTPRFVYALAAVYARAGDRARGLHYFKEARTRAAAAGQTQLLSQIERDLRALEKLN